MAERKKSNRFGGILGDKQTRALIAVGLLLAVVVYVVYTKGNQAERDTARANLTVQQDILKREQASAAKFLQNDAEKERYRAAVEKADTFLPYHESANDLTLVLPGILSGALTAAGLPVDVLPVPTLLVGVSGLPEGVGLYEVAISVDGTPSQVSTFVKNVNNTGKVLATVSAMSLSAPAPKTETDKPDLRNQGPQTMQVTIRLWFTTMAPLAQAATTTTQPGQAATGTVAPTATSTPAAVATSAP